MDTHEFHSRLRAELALHETTIPGITKTYDEVAAKVLADGLKEVSSDLRKKMLSRRVVRRRIVE